MKANQHRMKLKQNMANNVQTVSFTDHLFYEHSMRKFKRLQLWCSNRRDSAKQVIVTSGLVKASLKKLSEFSTHQQNQDILHCMFCPEGCMWLAFSAKAPLDGLHGHTHFTNAYCSYCSDCFSPSAFPI